MIPLLDLARIVRSKNAGPFALTLDILFRDRAAFDLVRQARVLKAERIASLYRVPLDQILWCGFYEPALAFKVTFARQVSSGTTGDRDVFGAQQHTLLLDLRVPGPQ